MIPIYYFLEVKFYSYFLILLPTVINPVPVGCLRGGWLESSQLAHSCARGG